MPVPLKFLLINPTAPQWRVTDGRSPRRRMRAFRFSMLPSLYVAAAMPAHVQTRIVDEDVEPVDVNAAADLVGFSVMTFNAPRAYELADAFRARGIPVIMGGYHATFLPQEALQHADAVCAGEAEPNIPRMIADLEAGKLSGVYESELMDLRSLPRPDRRLIQGRRYITANAVQATRGCTFHCSFCSVAAFARHRYRTRPVSDVIAELRTLRPVALFLDDNIVADPDYARALFAAMIPLRMRWFGQACISVADDAALLNLAARSGCRGLFIGLESLSPANLAGTNKFVNLERDYTRAIAALHRAGIGVFAGVMFGMDDDRPDVFARTLRFLDDARADVLQTTVMTPFPGTVLFTQMERDGRILDKDWSKYDYNHAVFQPAHMSPATLEAGNYWVRAQFYSRRSLAARVTRAFGCLPPWTVIWAMAPLNFAYRSRFITNRVFTAAQAFGRCDDRLDPGATAI